MKFGGFFRNPSANEWSLLHDVGVRFPDDVHQILIQNFDAVIHRYLAKQVAETLVELSSLDIPRQSELTHLYVNYGRHAVSGWYELNDVDTLASWTDYAVTELEVPQDFVALSSIEGQGIVLLNRLSGAVYDVEYGQFEALGSGDLMPVANSIADYVRWCASR